MKYSPLLWVHGHTHNNIDYRLENTRVICNQRGYSSSHLNEDFDESLTIEI